MARRLFDRRPIDDRRGRAARRAGPRRRHRALRRRRRRHRRGDVDHRGGRLPQRAVGLELRDRRRDRRRRCLGDRARGPLAPPAARRERGPVGDRLRRSSAASPSAACRRPAPTAQFARGLVDGWADLLSSAPPADITEQLRALPFTVAWLAAAIGGEIARHSRRPGLPAIGPILALALSLLFTIEERWLALAQGAGILAGTLLLIAAGQRLGRGRTRRRDLRRVRRRRPTSTNRTRLMLGAVVVVGAVVAAPLLGPHLPLAEANERFDLRRYQVPPFDPLAVPSPLGRGQGVAQGRAQGRRRVHGQRRHARAAAGRSP